MAKPKNLLDILGLEAEPKAPPPPPPPVTKILVGYVAIKDSDLDESKDTKKKMYNTAQTYKMYKSPALANAALKWRRDPKGTKYKIVPAYAEVPSDDSTQ
jgi:hypothetical protein